MRQIRSHCGRRRHGRARGGKDSRTERSPGGARGARDRSGTCAALLRPDVSHEHGLVLQRAHVLFARAKRWVFPASNFSVPYAGGYREFYACHFIAPNAQTASRSGIMRPMPQAAARQRSCSTRARCWRAYEEGRGGGFVYLERNVVRRARCRRCRVKTAEGDTLPAPSVLPPTASTRACPDLGPNRQRPFLFTAGSVSYYVTGVHFTARK